MKKIAILYQAGPAPTMEGVTKPMKQGGYSDSGADLAFALSKSEKMVVTPINTPRENVDLDWVFPDTEDGINSALDQKVEILWLNTVLYADHPIQKFKNKGLEIIGQDAEMVEIYDNKWTTNQLLSKNNIPIPEAFIIHKDTTNLSKIPFSFPLILKPIRGRGSQGVTFIEGEKELKSGLENLFESKLFGTSVYAESYLSGNEITVTIMPPGSYNLNGKKQLLKKHWCLPPVLRYNHQNGIAPYSGNVAVIHNSKVLSAKERKESNIQKVLSQCAQAASILKVKAPIRIDCRANQAGAYYLFDLNLKPNMTGNIRIGRKDQNSLSALAASAMGWSYTDLIMNIFDQKWSF
ncbi:ATP-grasp domain-containing protein [Lutimonas halocynthiae]|uniref:ATP-grasp domain-containing protein n=1 Tax=Lutimonas halocynthiae TaxID=1446477 RepID=UPI0025B5E693|nr:ATP-grasp domain-containing protein [Lutimonas halocynthiae]MDN3641215.1 ATP-grasp domain-containing protein [Lutimonas halocynthiae]